MGVFVLALAIGAVFAVGRNFVGRVVGRAGSAATPSTPALGIFLLGGAVLVVVGGLLA